MVGIEQRRFQVIPIFSFSDMANLFLVRPGTATNKKKTSSGSEFCGLFQFCFPFQSIWFPRMLEPVLESSSFIFSQPFCFQLLDWKGTYCRNMLQRTSGSVCPLQHTRSLSGVCSLQALPSKRETSEILDQCEVGILHCSNNWVG